MLRLCSGISLSGLQDGSLAVTARQAAKRPLRLVLCGSDQARLKGEGRPSRMGRTAYLARLCIAIDLISDASRSWNLKQRD